MLGFEGEGGVGVAEVEGVGAGREVEDGEEMVSAADVDTGYVESGVEVGGVSVGEAEAAAGFVDGEFEGEGAEAGGVLVEDSVVELKAAGGVDEFEDVVVLSAEGVGERGMEGGAVGGDLLNAGPEGVAHEHMADPEVAPHAEGIVFEFVEIGLDVRAEAGGGEEIGMGDLMVGEDEVQQVFVETVGFEGGNAVGADVFFKNFSHGIFAHEVHGKGFEVVAGEESAVEGHEQGDSRKEPRAEGGGEGGGDEAEQRGVEEGGLTALKDLSGL